MKNINKNEAVTNITKQYLDILEEGKEELPTLQKKEREEAFTEKTRGLLQQRQNARRKKNYKAYKLQNWRFKKAKEKTKHK